MKKSLILTPLLLAVLAAQGQNWDEWFSQGSTQKKYHIRQIAALRTYLEYAKKGYSLVQKGLNTVENIKNGNLNLDRDFLNGFKNINPSITNSGKVIDIIMFQYYITRDMGRVYSFCSTNQEFTPEEVRYIAKVHTNLLMLTDANMTELGLILRPGSTEMSDDERMSRLDRIHEDMQDKLAFVKAFSNDTRMISIGRVKEKSEIHSVRASSGIL